MFVFFNTYLPCERRKGAELCSFFVMEFEKSNILDPCEIKKQFEYIEKIKCRNDEYYRKEGKRRGAFVMTFGCQQNEADSEKLMGMAQAMGYDVVYEPAQASLILVNTCAVREHAEKRALSIIGQYKHLKAKNPELLISVCGCMVTQGHRADELKHSYPYVDIVFGTSSIHRLPELIFEKLNCGKRQFCPAQSEYKVAEGLPIRREDKARAWVSVMYGCNNFCSYCIVPYVRGRERSRTKEAVYAEVESLVKSGYKDITLLGQNVNSYGKDSGYGYDFADLLAELDGIEGDYMLHFMTSHPKDATKKLIDVMSSGKHIAKHFHLPMQAGSDRVLAAMNRRYTFEKYISILDYIREKMPDAVITSDIMVGFPGETEEDFGETLKALERAEFDMIFSFIYSPRKGTPAAESESQIPDSVKSERFDRLLKCQNEISLGKNMPMVDKTVRVLCDGRSKNDESVFSGRTEGNKIVFFDGEDSDTGEFLNIRVERAETFALWGKIVR